MLKRIVVGVIVFEGRVLIDRRPAGGALGGLWEFPGGKILVGETPEECVRREVQEEVGLDVEVCSELATIEHDYPEFSLLMTAYLCRTESNQAKPLASDEVLWIEPEQLDRYTFPEANRTLLPLIQACLTR